MRNKQDDFICIANRVSHESMQHPRNQERKSQRKESESDSAIRFIIMAVSKRNLGYGYQKNMLVALIISLLVNMTGPGRILAHLLA